MKWLHTPFSRGLAALRRRPALQRLVWACLALAGSTPAPVIAAPPLPAAHGQPVVERIAAIRARLQAQDQRQAAQRALAAGRPQAAAPRPLAQWANWAKWQNWSKWNNWGKV